MFAEVYRRSQARTTELGSALTPDQLAATVPATPLWTARQLLAHLAGVASDVVQGRVDGAATDPWTAAQVAARADRSASELLVEWAELAPRIGDGLASRAIPVAVAQDAFAHEADLREAFGLGEPPAEDVDIVLDSLARGRCGGYPGPGALVLRAGRREWTGGTGDPVTAETSPYELYRGLMSRRSRAQLRAWTWVGDPEPVIGHLLDWAPGLTRSPGKV